MRNRATKLGATGLNRFKRNPLNLASWKLFNNNELSPLVTSTRTTKGWYFDSTGTLQEAAVNTPRVSYDAADLSLGPFLLAEEARTNSIRNNTMQGAVAGVPGTLPTNWGNNIIGLTRTVVGTGVENGIPFVDVRLNGTTTGQFGNILFETNNAIAAASGQSWAGTAYLRVIAGSTANLSAVGIALYYFNSSVAFISSTNTPSSVGSTFSRIAHFGTAPGNTAFVQPAVYFNTTAASGQAIDITLRIGLPQLELGATASSPILTFSSAVTRSADNLSVTNLGATGFNASEGTLYADFQTSPSVTGVPCVVSLDDNTNNHRIQLRRANNDLTASLRMVSPTGSVDQAQINGTAGSRHRQAVAFISGAQSWSSNGVLIGGFTSLPTLPVVNRLQLGQGPGSNTFQGRIYQAAVIPKRLPDASLQKLTRV